MQTKKFQKKIEDFICERCSEEIRGNGFTDHCHNCLWSKHVDVNPGDRASVCGGLMRPTGIKIKGENKIIEYLCEKCGYEHRVKATGNDNLGKIIEISAKMC